MRRGGDVELALVGMALSLLLAHTNQAHLCVLHMEALIGKLPAESARFML